MRITRPWRIAIAGAGAAALAAGLGGAAVASDRIDLRDRVQPIHVTSQYGVVGADDSAESADSPYASPFDSTDSPADTPAHGADGSPESADSPNASATDSPNPAAKPKHTAKAEPATDDSAGSPAAAPRGGDSPASANSTDAGGSADSAD